MNVVRVAALMTLAAMGVTASRAQPAGTRSVKDGVYTAEQAVQGKKVYSQKCAECHGSMATTTPSMAPLLNDHLFQTTWKQRSLAELFDKIRESMPPDEAGTLSPQHTIDILAYILSANNLPAGDVTLPHDVETLKQIRLEAAKP